MKHCIVHNSSAFFFCVQFSSTIHPQRSAPSKWQSQSHSLAPTLFVEWLGCQVSQFVVNVRMKAFTHHKFSFFCFFHLFFAHPQVSSLTDVQCTFQIYVLSFYFWLFSYVSKFDLQVCPKPPVYKCLNNVCSLNSIFWECSLVCSSKFVFSALSYIFFSS